MTSSLFSHPLFLIPILLGFIWFNPKIIPFVNATCNVTVPGNFTICKADFSPFAISLNRTKHTEADTFCQKFGRKLAILNNPQDVLHIAYLMYECAFMTGEDINSGWIHPNQPKVPFIASTSPACRGVNARGGLISGSPNFCDIDIPMYAICKSELSPQEDETDSDDTSESSSSDGFRPLNITNCTDTAMISRIFDAANHGKLGLFPEDQSNGQVAFPPLSIYNPNIAIITDDSRKGRNLEPEPVIGEAVSIVTDPLIDPNPFETPHCHPLPSLTIAPFHLLGFKLIQTKLPYDQAKCACQKLNMRLAFPNFITQWLAAFVLYQGSLMSKPLAWINSTPIRGPQQGCMALRSSRLVWNAPRVEAQNCHEHLPVLCQGPVVANWDEVLDVIQIMDKMIRFIPEMEQMPKMCPFIREIMSSLKPIPNMPNIDEILEDLFEGRLPSPFNSSSSPAKVIDASRNQVPINRQVNPPKDNGGLLKPRNSNINNRNLPLGIIPNGVPSGLSHGKESRNDMPTLTPIGNRISIPSPSLPGGLSASQLPPIPPMFPPINLPSLEGTLGNMIASPPSLSNLPDLLQVIQNPLRDLITNQIGTDAASQIISRIFSMATTPMMPFPIQQPQLNPILSILSLFPLPLPFKFHSASQFKPAVAVVGSIDDLRIVTTESLSPWEACQLLGLELGVSSQENFEKVVRWSQDAKLMASFIDEQGFIHSIMPNGAVYHQMNRLATQNSGHAVCQIVESN